MAWKEYCMRVGDKHGMYINVTPHPDAPDALLRLVSGDSDVNQTEFEGLDIALEPDFAQLLGEALIEMADKIRADQPR